MKKTFAEIYKDCEEELKLSPARVTLVSYTQNHADISAASARTCYHQKGIVFPQDMQKTPKTRERILQSTLKAGHLTTRQHSHYVFALENISRNVIWDFFHAHPYYNSEQVSQRYTFLNNSQNWYHIAGETPAELLSVYNSLHQKSYLAYQSLRKLLYNPILHNLQKIHKLKARRQPKELESMAQKKAAEFARYVLPLSTYARMYHTVSALTLLRYYHFLESSSLQADAPVAEISYPHSELRVIILKMVAEVVKEDASFAADLQKIELLRSREISLQQAQKRKEVHACLDKQIQQPYQAARLVQYPQEDALLNMLYLQGIEKEALSDGNIWRFLLSSPYNATIAESLNCSSQESLSRNAALFSFSFYHKISHTADSQEQRHRTLVGSRLSLAEQASLAMEYITPTILQQTPRAFDFYHKHMESYLQEVFAVAEKSASSVAFVSYLLPNAYPVRYFASGNLLNFFHKWKTRLCYNAQQEIFDLSLEEVKQVTQVLPRLKIFLGAPCHIRSTFIKPVCPEGSHYCGIKVWQKSLDEMQRQL